MADPAHKAKLEEGVEAWNKWREESKVYEPNLEGLDLSHGTFRDINFVHANLKKVNLSATNLTNARLHGANLEDANLEAATLKDAHMSESNMKQVELNLADLQNAVAGKVNLSGAKISNANLEKCSLSGAILKNSELWLSNLKFGYFKNTIFDNSNLVQADLEGANLYCASFRNSQLSGVNFEGAYLVEADISNAILDGVNLEGANITGIKFNKRKMKCRGIRVETCYGSPMFKRFAQDTDYIEEFRENYYLLFYLWQISCSCGLSFLRWGLWSILFALFFALVFFNLGQNHFNLGGNDPLPFNGITVIYYSVVTFTTLGFGDITPKTTTAALIVMAEVILGYIMLGGLISIMATKLARRS